MINIKKQEPDTNEILIKGLYNQTLENFVKLNETFNISQPIEIFSMFLFALNNGYLSKNKTFRRGTCEIENIKSIYGTMPITGNGVCRHIAPMLKDIFKKNNIESTTQIVFQGNDYKYDIPKELMEAMNTMTYQELIDNREFIMQKFKYEMEQQNETNRKAQRYGNHVITLALANGKLHIYDPTQEKIYQPSSLEKRIFEDTNSNKILAIYNKKTFTGTKKELKESKKYLDYPIDNIEYETSIIGIYIRLFKENRDLFEKMYQENKELYDEICDKLSIYKRENSYGTERCNIYR